VLTLVGLLVVGDEWDWACRRRSGEPALRYVGTPHGLAGFIDDLHRLGIADGVTLRPQRLAACPEDSINEMLQALIG
jgi:hypothetical protein